MSPQSSTRSRPISPCPPRTPRSARKSNNSLSVPRSRKDQQHSLGEISPRYRPRSPNVIDKESGRRLSPSKPKRKGDYPRPIVDHEVSPGRLGPILSSLSVLDGPDHDRRYRKKKHRRVPASTIERCFAEILSGAVDSKLEGEITPTKNSTWAASQENQLPSVAVRLGAPEQSPESPEPLSPTELFDPAVPKTPPVSMKPMVEDLNFRDLSTDLYKLLNMIRTSPEHWKELVDVVQNYLHIQPKISETTVDGSKTCLSPKYRQTSPFCPQVASFPGGGDSPPGDPNRPFRGHMVERPDTDMQDVPSTCESQATTRTSSVVMEDIGDKATTRATSVVMEDINDKAPPTPVLKPCKPIPSDSRIPSLNIGADGLKSRLDLSRETKSSSSTDSEHRDDWMAYYYHTIASLPPKTLLPEDWRAIRSVLACSPESPIELGGFDIWGTSRHSNSSGASETTQSAPQDSGTLFGTARNNPFYRSISRTPVGGIGQTAYRSEASNTVAFGRPSPPSALPPSSVQVPPFTPLASPID